MNDKYKTYDNEEFEYYYPYSWEKRNIKYLETRDDRRITKLKPKVVIPTKEENH